MAHGLKKYIFCDVKKFGPMLGLVVDHMLPGSWDPPSWSWDQVPAASTYSE